MKPYYEQDGITIYHGDCREIDAWLGADVLVTDPPYGIAYASGWSSLRDSRTKTKKPVVNIGNDETVELRDEVLMMWGTRPAIVFGTWRIDRPAGTRQRLIWHKRNTNPGMGTGSPWYSCDEEIYVLGGGFSGASHQGVIPTDEYRASDSGQPAQIGHPTPKPLRLMEHLVERCPAGTVADPFAGSGSTLLAARSLNRKAIGIEIEERYCEIAAKRLAQGVFDLRPPADTEASDG